MSNALAFATVTQALALLIGNNLQPEIDMAVSVETRKPPAEPPTDPTINVFLYQVAPNASMRHTDLPTRASDGTLVKRPAAALDLNFLITAYGEETELVGQRLIGCVVRTLHEIPVLPGDVIEQAAELPYLAGSDLAESLQKVRFTPIQMDIDETSKLWGMLHQTPYALSVAYQASLVFIEGREKPVPAKPVRERAVRVAPFGAPGAPQPPSAGTPEAAVDGAGAAGAASATSRTAEAAEAANGERQDRADGRTSGADGRTGGAATPRKATGRATGKGIGTARGRTGTETSTATPRKSRSGVGSSAAATGAGRTPPRPAHAAGADAEAATEPESRGADPAAKKAAPGAGSPRTRKAPGTARRGGGASASATNGADAENG
ncbi:DUF4255 domain-containing protein [Streptomyces sp. NPDC048639]|uniref:DUF4255 domain-containing protein n=1 Tax=Streptomyces sp. NPDC048639 TaxID=3365581 RepID=UPI00372314A7